MKNYYLTSEDALEALLRRLDLASLKQMESHFLQSWSVDMEELEQFEKYGKGTPLSEELSAQKESLEKRAAYFLNGHFLCRKTYDKKLAEIFGKLPKLAVAS
ncbi:hypothetical protein V9K67_16025 [Paraflavisolibacter sp. H34]|uniref:hypothetical protein n=1 Tax=Huijunlia imazamoxiresistens TaxID=3127457 RepID=UPI003017B15C